MWRAVEAGDRARAAVIMRLCEADEIDAAPQLVLLRCQLAARREREAAVARVAASSVAQ